MVSAATVLPEPGLADDPERPAPVQGERHAAHGLYHAIGGVEGDGQVADVEQRLSCHRCPPSLDPDVGGVAAEREEEERAALQPGRVEERPLLDVDRDVRGVLLARNAFACAQSFAAWAVVFAVSALRDQRVGLGLS